MTILNYTPHSINLCGAEYQSQGLARVQTSSVQVAEVNGIPVNKVVYGDVTGLPEEKDGVFYIVSTIVANAVKGVRNDCLIVDKTIRNDAGQVIGCEALARI